MAAIGAQLHPVGATMFVGTQVEGIVCTVLLAFWTTIVAINTDAGDSLRENGVTDESNAVQNANLYYFSWAGFITSVMLMVSFLRDATGIDMIENVQSRGKRLNFWGAYLATAIVVLGGASRTLHSDCPDEDKPGYCPKTTFAIVVGFFGCLLSILVIVSKVVNIAAISGSMAFMLELGSSVFLTIMSALGVAYTTSAGGPGSQVGNLYYFSWGSFLLSSVLAAECYKEYANPPAEEASVASGHPGNGSINGRSGDVVMVDKFDDAI